MESGCTNDFTFDKSPFIYHESKKPATIYLRVNSTAQITS